MGTILGDIINFLNTSVGLPGSLITIYDHFKNRDNTHIEETFNAIRNQSKKAYDSYCKYRQHRKDDIGIPVENDILGYWQLCLERNKLPSVADMVSLNMADKQEAEIMLLYLLEFWMEIPDFVEWLHDILVQSKLEELSRTLLSLQKNLEGISRLENELKQQNICKVANIISPNRIINEKYSCNEKDVKYYYMVYNRFETMLKVICAEQDIPYIEMNQKLIELVENCHPVIIAGNGGLGKTSMMMRVAVYWASRGRVVVWLSLSNKDIITEQEAANFFSNLTTMIPAGQRALLCIDNPYEGKDSFSNLQKRCPSSDKIQLIVAERANRLTLLADPNQDYLLYWFDDAQMVILQGLYQTKATLDLKGYISYPFPETQNRRKKYWKNALFFL